MDERASIGFGTALLAVFLGGIVGGAVTAAVGRGNTTSAEAVVLIVFLGILVGAAALSWFLRLSGWSISPAVAVGIVAAAHILSLVAPQALAHAKMKAVRHAPSALPGLDVSFTGFGALVGLVVLFLEAWIVQSVATQSSG